MTNPVQDQIKKYTWDRAAGATLLQVNSLVDARVWQYQREPVRVAVTLEVYVPVHDQLKRETA